MHASIQQRVDGVAALHLRSRIATDKFYALIGKEQPVQKIRFQIKNVGNAYHIVELSTGKVKGFRWNWKEASNLAQALESRADGVKVTLSGCAQ
ncbi:hypothetical protein HX787_10805 [Pseudomonas tolaasii]|uniref:Uncharacterized protein n=2 Tax=Pseudomonas tolaasii TaxID=29442 RepID=A0A7Y8ALK5_PSETO|nr:hypothetical protein [Pseudomonas tolaasii]ARB26194.1 hypothetical protein B5P22_02450 [Pseudomonas tolaasii]KAB0478512.1 hypothetical protein F7R12_04470 [Pseudomonas tolaasii]NWC23301.1 hypothetical protein [Pseudomonas tolaasii]NWC37826.1 hypothetical protein [Pseudomonas tolaasii]NWD36338.1 hypothetical protein [Pseudomonas tolaasii]